MTENTKAEDQVEKPEANGAEISADAEAAVVDPILEEAADSDDQAEEQADNDTARRIEELEEQLAQAKDQTLRAHAEAMNTKRRAEQDVEKAHKFALEKFVNELIPVVESLEKGIESAEQGEGQHETMLEGMRLTCKQLLDALAKFNVEQVNPEGQPFDPNFHQAISMVPNPDMEPNTVMNVFQKGYTLHGRVIRPAMVVVSKAA
ncbi:nucleotide exchange factor GrpE [Endozoicomonas sp. YOMI1]|uniref:nucleotide exchange factor GrpE n=1 Tax=Endozoicomonas sp. YOMI1 TaxID=2828739 RepID=UPI00214885B9|nr:nucleotide exchange factor GrpE [Endozoicomonas sp. YOMI1]